MSTLFAFLYIFFLPFFGGRKSTTQSRRRDAANAAKVDKKETVTFGCAFPGAGAPVLFPSAGLEAGAILETGGKGDSVTSDSVSAGSGASAGGKYSGAIAC